MCCFIYIFLNKEIKLEVICKLVKCDVNVSVYYFSLVHYVPICFVNYLNVKRIDTKNNRNYRDWGTYKVDCENYWLFSPNFSQGVYKSFWVFYCQIRSKVILNNRNSENQDSRRYKKSIVIAMKKVDYKYFSRENSAKSRNFLGQKRWCSS